MYYICFHSHSHSPYRTILKVITRQTIKHPSIAFSIIHYPSLIPASSQRVHSNSLLRPILLALLSDPRNVALASDVPQRNVLLHACRQTAFFGGREGRTGGGDAFVEAVLVDFLHSSTWLAIALE